MATSGTYDFSSSTQIASIVTEAFERLGVFGEQVSGDMLRSATHSLNYLVTEWLQDGSRQFAIQQFTYQPEPNQQGQYAASFQMPAGCYDILSMVSRLNGIDIGMTCISREEYLFISDKAVGSAQCVNYWIDKTTYPATIVLYPLPNTTTQSIVYNALQATTDINDPSLQPGVTPWWLDALASGLAARLAEKFKPERYEEKMGIYTRAYTLARRADVDQVYARVRSAYRF